MNSTTIGRIILALGLAVRHAAKQPRAAILSVRLASWIVLISMLVRVTSLSRAQQIASFRFRSRVSPPAGHEPAELGELARAVDRLLALDLFVFRPICWKRAMVLQRFLLLRGVESRINFGVQKPAGEKVSGHAWLERHGQPFLEKDAVPYVVTFSLPART